MQQSRGGRRQYSRHAQGDQGQVEAYDEAVAVMDAAHQGLAELSQDHQLEQVFGGNGDVRDLPGNGGTGGNGNARIRFRQGG